LKTEETSKLEILRELSDVIPPTVWIWNMKLRSKDIEINGFANSASDLIAILDKSPLFEKVEFSSPVTKERRPTGDPAERERFRISAKIERTQ
jgi:general secretion pathway protein L